jgi:hypothetical protein
MPVSIFVPLARLTDPADTTRQQEFDSLHRAPLIIDVAHHEIHEGDAFLSGHADTSMNNGATIILAFKTPPGTKRIHMLYEFSTLAGGHLDIYKDSTWNASTGTLLPVYNHKQMDTPDSSAMLEDQSTGSFIANDNIILDPVNHSAGTQVIPTKFAFGAQLISAESRAVAEILLEVDTLHSFVFTADGNSNAGQLLLNWYEHTDS